MPRKPRNDDDLLQDLPPIDGEQDDEAEETEVETDLDLDAEEKDRDLDDSVASELQVGELIDAIDEDGDGGTEDARELDIGAPAIDIQEERGRSDDDAPGLANEDTSVGIEPVADQESIGSDFDEQPGASGDDIDESSLPELDSDDEADLPGGLAIDDTLDLPDEVSLPVWASSRFERVSTTPLVGLPMNAIALHGEQLAVAGQGVVLIGPDSTGSLDARFLEVDSAGDEELISIALGTNNQVLVVSHCATYRSTGRDVSLRRTLQTSAGDSQPLVSVHALRADLSLLCALSSSAALVVSTDQGEAWHPVASSGRVVALSVEEGATLVAALHGDETSGVVRTRDGVSWEVLSLDRAHAPLSWAHTCMVCARGDLLAVGSSQGAIGISTDRGLSWTTTAVPLTLTAMTWVARGQGASLLGTFYVESQDKSYLFSIEPGAGPKLLADLCPDVGVGRSDEIDDSEGLGRATAMAWDEARGWLWVAGRFGLQAWRGHFPS